MKLTVKDIKIIGEGAQIRNIIINKYGALEPYIQFYVEKHSDIISEVTLRNYLNSKTIHSKSFKVRLMYDLDIDFDKDIVYEEKQIAAYIESINANISEYKSDKDTSIFNHLESMCQKKEYHNLLSKLYKAQSIYYSNRNEVKESIRYLHMAIENEKNPKNQMHYYSDLGLIYYLKKKLIVLWSATQKLTIY
jgi:hypothetical protein